MSLENEFISDSPYKQSSKKEFLAWKHWSREIFFTYLKYWFYVGEAYIYNSAPSPPSKYEITYWLYFLLSPTFQY